MCRTCVFFFFKQKTAYEMRISDWSSDVCSSDLASSSTGRWRTASSRQPNSTTCRCRRSWSARTSSTGPPSSNPPGNRRKSPPLQGEGWVGMGFPTAASRPSADKTQDREREVEAKRVHDQVHLGLRRDTKKKTTH